MLKLRLTEMCDRLGNAELRKIGFSMGPRRVITYKVLFEVRMVNICYGKITRFALLRLCCCTSPT